MKSTIKALALAIVLAPNLAYSFEYKLFAVVNDEPITTQQVKDRVQLVMSSSGLPNNQQSKIEVTKEVAEILINEILQKQEAAEKGIKVESSDMQQVLSQLEQRNQLKAGGFKGYIEKKGLSYQTMEDQIYASILWKKVLAAFIQPKIEVTEADIKKAEENKPKIVQKYKVDLSEIVIPIEFASEQESKDLADTLVRTARSGAKSFGELAGKYSAGKTALQNGRLGWVAEDGIKEPIGSIVKKISKGGVSNPIKVESLYVIVKVNDRQGLIPEDNTPPKERAFAAKMEEGAKQYIKTLRDAAVIDKKYKDGEVYNFIWN